MGYRAVVDAILLALGSSDCEAVGSGWLSQPVNALTSLSYAVVGVALVPWALGARAGERWLRVLIATGLVLTGVGSAMYHGPQGPGSGFLHDASFLLVLVSIGVADIAVAARWTTRSMEMAVVVAVATVAVVVALLPSATNVAAVAAGVVIVVGDVGLRRVGKMDWRWYLVAVVAFVAAVVAYLAGRTGSPVCAPGSAFQWHGAWHVLSAVAIGAYAVATGSARSEGLSTA